MQTRRDFGKMAGTGALALGIGEISMGMSCQTVVDTMMQYVPVALAALSGILSVLSGNGINLSPVAALALATAKASFADLAADMAQYKNAPASAKATLLGKVSTVLTIVEANIQQFWNDLNLPRTGNVTSIVEGILTIVLSTLGAFATQLPAPLVTAALNEAKTRRATLTRKLIAPAKKRSLKEFKTDLNNAFDSTGVKIY